MDMEHASNPTHVAALRLAGSSGARSLELAPQRWRLGWVSQAGSLMSGQWFVASPFAAEPDVPSGLGEIDRFLSLFE